MTNNRNNFNWNIIDDSSFPDSRTEKAFDNVMVRARRKEAGNRRRTTAWRWAVAAAIIILPSFAILISGKFIGKDPAVEILTASAENGQTKTVTLPDSTKVMLNSGSAIFYPEKFSRNERRVCLSGEAVFDVTKDNARPFLVSTSDITIKVFGTLFNVQAYPENDIVTATLCTGSVGISRNSDQADVAKLRPGEEFKMLKSNGVFKITTVDAEEATIWKDGGICLNDGTIHDLIHIMERQFNVNIYLTSEKYDSEVITAKFIHGESIGDILKVISSLLPEMKYTITNNNIYIH